MQNTMLLFAFIVLFSTVQTGLLASYCNDVKYTTISDARRSTAFKTKISQIVPHDRLIIQNDVWYRFSSDAGGEMPTTQPLNRRCRTNVPLWMNGTHPTVEEGTVKRKVCANIPHKIPIGCGSSYTINVRNCSGFYIYQLKTPEESYVGYCAGSKLPNCTGASPKDYCLENSPPKINMPYRLYTYENIEFQLFFDATDREGYPLKYDFDHSKTSTDNVSIDQANKLVTISSTKSGRVVLIVKEDVSNGLQSNHAIMIHVQPCPCRNGGKCHSNVSTEREDLPYTCECVIPDSGENCEKSPCDSSPCFAGLKCFVMTDSYMCENCPAKFKGDGKECERVLTKETVVVKAELTIDAGLEWNDDLLNNTSLLYKQRTTEIVAQITQAYKSMKDFLYVVVIAYRYSKGSVVVEFELVMKTKVEDPLKRLKEYIQDNGTLGKFKVQPKNVGKKTPPSGEKTYFGIHKTVFIVVVCFVSLLFLTLIVACGICIKKKKVSIIMFTINDDRPEMIQENGNEPPHPHKKSRSRNQVMDLTLATRSS